MFAAALPGWDAPAAGDEDWTWSSECFCGSSASLLSGNKKRELISKGKDAADAWQKAKESTQTSKGKKKRMKNKELNARRTITSKLKVRESYMPRD